MTDLRTLPDPGPEPALEDEVRDLLARAMDGAEPAHGLAGATLEGRRLRRRRRVGVATVTTLAGAAAAVTVAAALAGGTSPTRAVDTPPAETPSAVVTVAPTSEDPERPGNIPLAHWRQFPPEWKAYFGAEGPAWTRLPAAEVRDRLARVLPDGVRIVSAELTSDDVAPGESHEVRGMVRVVLDAAGARGSLEVMLNAEPPPPPEPGVITVQDPDGDVTYGVESQPTKPGGDDGVHRAGDITVITATALVPDGWVYVSTANSLDDKWGRESTASAAAPLLTQRQVEALAAADVWVE